MRVVVAIVLTLASTALAQAPNAKAKAQALFVQGETLYANLQYLEAAEKFVSAYTFDPDPAFLFNIAQAYRLAGVCQKAADYYRRLLAAVPNPPSRNKLARYVDEMDACAERQAEQRQPRLQEPPSAVEPPAEATVPGEPGQGERALGLGLGVFGVVAVGVGVYFHSDMSSAESAQHTCVDTKSCTWATVENYNNRGTRDSALAITAYSIGGAAIAGGVLLYVLGRQQTHEVAVVPTAGGASVSAAFRF